jgi:hypothetical protein
MDQCNTEKLMARCWRKMGSRVDLKREKEQIWLETCKMYAESIRKQ